MKGKQLTMKYGILGKLLATGILAGSSVALLASPASADHVDYNGGICTDGSAPGLGVELSKEAAIRAIAGTGFIGDGANALLQVTEAYTAGVVNVEPGAQTGIDTTKSNAIYPDGCTKATTIFNIQVADYYGSVRAGNFPGIHGGRCTGELISDARLLGQEFPQSYNCF